MKRRYGFAYIAVALVLMAGAAMPQVRTKQRDKAQRQSSTTSDPAQPASVAAASASVTGSGTAGQLVKFAGDGSAVANSNVTETKPDMMNIYNGTVTTDVNGDATVTLPDWFEALNQDFRYQLTVIGTFAQAIVGQKVKGNRFTVKTNAPNVEVSWQVTGVRHDAYANKHRIPVEEQKLEEERGLFLHPDAFNQPEEKGVQFVRTAPQIERMNAAREQAKQRSPQR